MQRVILGVIPPDIIERNRTFYAEDSAGTKKIQYKLKDGDASRKFVIDKTTEYPVK